MPCYSAYLLALLNTCLAATYFGLRHRDSEVIPPTWHTVASFASISVLLVLYILAIVFERPLYKNHWLFYTRTVIMVPLIVFYVTVTIMSYSPEHKAETKCVYPSVRCHLGWWLINFTYSFIPVGLVDAIFISCYDSDSPSYGGGSSDGVGGVGGDDGDGGDGGGGGGGDD
ncbi:hypothetical protein BGZ88_011606 [Linnemannia elongata]|nr:hypothetical protein BGZ88_011606 [Linnemannia elongata]